MGPKPKYIPRYLKKFGAASLSRPRGLAGRICVGRGPPAIAIAYESRQNCSVFRRRLVRLAGGIRAVILCAHFRHDFDRTGTPADRCLAGSSVARPTFASPPKRLPSLRLRSSDHEQSVRYRWSSGFDVSASRSGKAGGGYPIRASKRCPDVAKPMRSPGRACRVRLVAQALQIGGIGAACGGPVGLFAGDRLHARAA